MKAAAEVHRLPVYSGKMSKKTINQLYKSASQLPTSPFPVRHGANPRLKLNSSVCVEVPGLCSGQIGYQGWGFGLGSVSLTSQAQQLGMIGSFVYLLNKSLSSLG